MVNLCNFDIDTEKWWFGKDSCGELVTRKKGCLATTNNWANRVCDVSSDQKPRLIWIYKGWKTTQLHRDHEKNSKDPYEPPRIWWKCHVRVRRSLPNVNLGKLTKHHLERSQSEMMMLQSTSLGWYEPLDLLLWLPGKGFLTLRIQVCPKGITPKILL